MEGRPEVLRLPLGRSTSRRIGLPNVDDFPAPASQFGVRGIPTLILFKDGEVVQQFVGVQQENVLVDAIEAAL